jgi:peptide/nickel transport system permease protein
MQTIFLMLVISVLVANFIADSIYVILDPRTREN